LRSRRDQHDIFLPLRELILFFVVDLFLKWQPIPRELKHFIFAKLVSDVPANEWEKSRR
jgi:hypothetical protein